MSDVEAHQWGSLNTNEEALADDEVEGHKLSANTNEEGLVDEDRDKLSANENEDVVAED